ncbi:hypothetical protein niasHS_002471 [Heterodera schachtii]|uniref:Basic leucine zipper domain-containing protein n=1 Tax=Heterodera schachtii TaxID=97005 RepID=A0ABD2KKY0_HETSC
MEEVASLLTPNEAPFLNFDHSNSMAVPSQFAPDQCPIRFPRPLPPPFPAEHPKEKRENSLLHNLITPWNRSFVPSTDFSHRLLSSPESTESSQSFMVKNDMTCSARRSLSSELEKNATGDGKVPMADWELIRLSVRELNQRLVGQDRSVVSAVKQKRRTLKNRGYALNCRTRRMRNQQQLEAENNYLRQLVAKQSALLKKYEQKMEEREKKDDGTTQKAEGTLGEDKPGQKWHESKGKFARQSNSESAQSAALAEQRPTLDSCPSVQMCADVPFVPYDGTPSAQQPEMFYPFVYQPPQFSATQMQIPYYHAVFRGNGADEAAEGQQNWDQFSR